jgi:hypothetical protein
MKQEEETNDENVSEAVVHYVHHREADANREVTINGSVYTVSLSSNDPEENIDYLSKKAMELLNQLRKEGN